MSNVNLAIGGRTFTVACADGEEAHVTALARTIDAKLSEGLRRQSEPRMLLYAALMLADELHEAQARLAMADETAGNFDERLARVADRLEALARDLEDAGQSA